MGLYLAETSELMGTSLFQHNSILGSVFADFYDQQLPSIQASALSQQVRQKLQAFLG